MSYPSGSRRIGPIRASLSNFSPIFPRPSSGSGLDDKNVKADGSVDKTNSFIFVLLIIIIVLCGVLSYSHYNKQSQPMEVEKNQLRPLPNIMHTAGSILLEPEHVGPNNIMFGHGIMPKDSAETIESAKQKKTHSKDRNEQATEHAVVAQKDIPVTATKEHPHTTVNVSKITIKSTKVDWEGCLYELPPLVVPTTAAKGDAAHKQHNDKSTVGYDYNRRHIVAPPAGEVTLVCCNTTKGVLNIEVHSTWAPRGAERFLLMVNSGFFSTEVGLFRALRDFLVQFGLAGDPALQKAFHELGNLKDDPPWLPLGPTGREINGTKRFQKGYLAYAGGGKNSRGTQLIMAFQDNLYLGGGSPWEVPFAQVFGASSFETIGKIYTKYGEKPSQSKIMNRGTAYLKEEFPLLDYVNKCAVTKEHVPWSYVHDYVHYR